MCDGKDGFSMVFFKKSSFGVRVSTDVKGMAE